MLEFNADSIRRSLLRSRLFPNRLARVAPTLYFLHSEGEDYEISHRGNVWHYKSDSGHHKGNCATPDDCVCQITGKLYFATPDRKFYLLKPELDFWSVYRLPGRGRKRFVDRFKTREEGVDFLKSL